MPDSYVRKTNRQAAWKREWITGDLERRGKCILHVREIYTWDEISQFHFYFTDEYRAVDKLVYDAGSMNTVQKKSVPMPSAMNYMQRLAIFNAVPLGYLFWSSFENPGRDFSICLLLLYLSRRYMRKSKINDAHDMLAWEKYREYTASLGPTPEPEEMDIEPLTQPDFSQSPEA